MYVEMDLTDLQGVSFAVERGRVAFRERVWLDVSVKGRTVIEIELTDELVSELDEAIRRYKAAAAAATATA